MTMIERIVYDREVADLRAGMDASVFDAAWIQGHALNIEQATEYSLRD